MRLLVTGGAGYIGSIVAQQLLDRGDEVTVLDSLYRGHRAAVPAGAEFVQVDLLDPDAVNAAVQGFDGVLHFAALSLVAESVEFPERYYRGNVVGALNLLDAMRAAGDQTDRLLLAPAATYGEPDVDLITEDEPNKPVNPYGELEAGGRPHARRRGPRARAGARPCATSTSPGASRTAAGRGPRARDAPDPARPAGRGRASARASTIFGTDYPTPDGTCVRDYIHVEDLAARTSSRSSTLEPGRQRHLQPRQRARRTASAR